MRIRKNGFTLIELLAVIVILAVILTIATTMVIKNIKNSKEDTRYFAAKEIVEVASSYMSVKNCNKVKCSELIDKGYLENDATNPLTGKNDLKEYGSNIIVYYNPIFSMQKVECNGCSAKINDLDFSKLVANVNDKNNISIDTKIRMFDGYAIAYDIDEKGNVLTDNQKESISIDDAMQNASGEENQIVVYDIETKSYASIDKNKLESSNVVDSDDKKSSTKKTTENKNVSTTKSENVSTTKNESVSTTTTKKSTTKKVERSAPKITLNGGNQIYIEKGIEFDNNPSTVVGYVISDEIDDKNNLKVTRESVGKLLNTDVIGDYKIKYTVTNSANLSTSIEQNVHVGETKINLLSDEYGNNFNSPNGKNINEITQLIVGKGYTATDCAGNDITGKVVVNSPSEWNENKDGSYTFNYSVKKCNSNNKIIKTQTVNVKSPTIIVPNREIISPAGLMTSNIPGLCTNASGGCSATNYDGTKLQAWVHDWGGLNTDKDGSYTIKYKVNNGYRDFDFKQIVNVKSPTIIVPNQVINSITGIPASNISGLCINASGGCSATNYDGTKLQAWVHDWGGLNTDIDGTYIITYRVNNGYRDFEFYQTVNVNSANVNLSYMYNYPNNLDKNIMGNTDGVILMGVGETLQLEVSTNPYGAPLYFSSENPDFVSVDSNGVVYAKLVGKTKLVVRSGVNTKTLMVAVVNNPGLIPLKGRSFSPITSNIAVKSTVGAAKNPPIQTFYISDDGNYYFGYPSISHSSKYEASAATGMMMKCPQSDCTKTNKEYVAFKYAGHMQAFTMYQYGSKYILMNSKAEVKLNSNNGLYGGYSSYLYHVNADAQDSNGHSIINSTSNDIETVRNMANNWDKFNLEYKSTFAVPVSGVNGSGNTSGENPDISVDPNTYLMAIRHGNGDNIAISVYCIDLANINLNYELTRFKITKPDNATELSFQGIYIKGKYVYVLFSKPTKNGYNYAYIYTYDLFGNLIDNTYSIDQTSINSYNAETEGITYYNGHLYFIAAHQDKGNPDYKNNIYMIN